MNLQTLLGRASERLPIVRRAARRARMLPDVWRAAEARTRNRAPRHVAQVHYAAVLDGRTMNLDIAVPADVAPGTATVLFAGRRQRLTAPARIREVADGVVRISATVLLGEDGVPVHTERRWQLDCVTDTAGRKRSYALLGAPAATWPAKAPTLATPRCPRTGRRYQLRTGPHGRTTVEVQPSPRLAEVVRVDIGWFVASLEVRTIGFRFPQAPQLSLALRDGDTVHALATSLEGDRVRLDLPVALLAETVTAQEFLWELTLSGGGREARVSSKLHDLAFPKAAIRPSTSIVWLGDGVAVRIRPYFTPGGYLVLACLRLASTLPAAARESSTLKVAP